MKLSLFAIIATFITISASAITCNVDQQTTFHLYHTDNKAGFYLERMQSETLHHNDVYKLERKPVHIPVLNVKATEFRFIGTEGAIFSYLSLNQKIYQPKLILNSEEIKLHQCR